MGGWLTGGLMENSGGRGDLMPSGVKDRLVVVVVV